MVIMTTWLQWYNNSIHHHFIIIIISPWDVPHGRHVLSTRGQTPMRCMHTHPVQAAGNDHYSKGRKGLCDDKQLLWRWLASHMYTSPSYITIICHHLHVAMVQPDPSEYVQNRLGFNLWNMVILYMSVSQPYIHHVYTTDSLHIKANWPVQIDVADWTDIPPGYMCTELDWYLISEIDIRNTIITNLSSECWMDNDGVCLSVLIYVDISLKLKLWSRFNLINLQSPALPTACINNQYIPSVNLS